MLGTYSYNEIFRKTVVAFGTLFNNIEIKRTSGSKTEVMKVPLAYGPKEKFLARLRQVGDLTTKDAIQITLPRISFEISGFSYDATRKVSPTQVLRHVQSDGKTKKSFMPVPYNVDFELAIMSKNQDDGLQILEQILPFFQPFFNITINLVPELGESKDFPVSLNSVSYELRRLVCLTAKYLQSQRCPSCRFASALLLFRLCKNECHFQFRHTLLRQMLYH